MTRRLRSTAAMLLLVTGSLALASCASVEEPVVTLTGADFHGLSTEGLELRLLADVENPNGFGADISGLTYKVFVDGTEVAAGVQDDPVRGGARETVEVAIPFTLVWEGVNKGLTKLLDGKEHDWKLKGSVRLSNGPLSKTFKFSERGSFDSPKVENVQLDLDL